MNPKITAIKIINSNQVPEELLAEALEVLVDEQPATKLKVASNTNVTIIFGNFLFSITYLLIRH